MPDTPIDPIRKLLAAMKASAPTTDTSVPNNSITVRPPARIAFGSGGFSGLNPAPQPTAGGVSLPGVPTDVSPTTGPVNPDTYQRSPINIRLGANTAGMDPIDKSVAVLGSEREAARDYPSAKITSSGEILPPKMHHGLGDKLKSIGKGVVINMGRVAANNPNASAAELLAGGAAGGVVGGVSPISIDRDIANAAVSRHEDELGRQLGVEGQQAQVEAMKAKPVLDAQKLEIERQVAEGRISQEQAARRLEELKATETARHNRETESERRSRPKAEKAPLIRERTNADGSKATLQSDDNGRTWKEIPELADQPVAKEDTDSLVKNYDKRIGEYSSKAADLRKQAESLRGTTDYESSEDRKRFLAQADEADKEASRLRTERDKENAKPRRTATPRITSPTPNRPETRKGTINKAQQQKWMSDHPGKSLDDMKNLYPNAVMVN